MRFKLEQSDKRGEVYSFRLQDDPLQELMIFFTKKGYLRGGHSHNVLEYRVILKGEVIFIHKYPKEDIRFELKEGNMIVCPPNIPHLLESKADNWIMEWWEPNKETITDEELRSKVK